MKKILAATLCFMLALCAACSPAYAGALDMVLNQRNATDNGNLVRYISPGLPGSNCLFYFNYTGPAPLPYCMDIGSGLTVSNGVLSATPQAGQVNADWSATSGVAQILNKPALKTVALTGQAGDLMGLAPVALSGAYSDLTGKPVLFSGIYSELTGKPTFAAVATSGNYNDLTNRPTIPAAPLARAFSYRTPTMGACYQLSTTRDVQVSYSVDINASLTLSGQAKGSVYLRTYSDSACTAGQQTLTSGTGGLPSALSVAVGLQNLGSAALSAIVPAGAWVRVETVVDAGTVTFAARQGQEVAL